MLHMYSQHHFTNDCFITFYLAGAARMTQSYVIFQWVGIFEWFWPMMCGCCYYLSLSRRSARWTHFPSGLLRNFWESFLCVYRHCCVVWVGHKWQICGLHRVSCPIWIVYFCLFVSVGVIIRTCHFPPSTPCSVFFIEIHILVTWSVSSVKKLNSIVWCLGLFMWSQKTWRSTWKNGGQHILNATPSGALISTNESACNGSNKQPCS